ncbi:hypothetical protein [Rhizobium leguminosarum]|uniref:hypothetical protein n=1 Tax=Rhizobium leguminosarum TaxID=384 RepID=UPI002E0FB217|nr:hypothetical protein U8Q02_36250 [Rhizobium leguminosarum]
MTDGPNSEVRWMNPPAGYLVHPSERVVGLLAGPDIDIASWEARGETVEPLYTAAQVDEMRRSDVAALEELQEKIENAVMAASETQPTHKHRCVRIMGALGYDYGDPDWLTPGDVRRLDAALARVAELEGALEEKAMGQDDAARLLGVEHELRAHAVSFEPMLGEDAPWRVRSLVRRTSVSSHPTRWAAIRAAAKADTDEDC